MCKTQAYTALERGFFPVVKVQSCQGKRNQEAQDLNSGERWPPPTHSRLFYCLTPPQCVILDEQTLRVERMSCSFVYQLTLPVSVGGWASGSLNAPNYGYQPSVLAFHAATLSHIYFWS